MAKPRYGTDSHLSRKVTKNKLISQPTNKIIRRHNCKSYASLGYYQPASAGIVIAFLSFLLSLLSATLCDDVGGRSSYEERRAGTYDYTKQHSECEAADSLTTKNEDTEEYEQCADRCHDCTCQCAVQRVVECGELVLLRIESASFTHTVEYYHCIVHLITDNGEDCCDKRLVNLH